MGNEITNIEIHERPVLFDRIQLMVIPDFFKTDFTNNLNDYNLFCIGSFDELSGEICGEAPQLLIAGANVPLSEDGNNEDA